MPITSELRYFGEGLSDNYPEKDPQAAIKSHQFFVRMKRLDDLLGKEAKLDARAIIDKFPSIQNALNAADAQVKNDNAAFIKKHNLTF